MKKMILVILMFISTYSFAASKEQCERAKEIIVRDGNLIQNVVSNTFGKEADQSNLENYPVDFLKDYYSLILLQSLENDISEPVLLAHALTIKIAAFFQYSVNYAEDRSDENKNNIKNVRNEISEIGKRFDKLCPSKSKAK